MDELIERSLGKMARQVASFVEAHRANQHDDFLLDAQKVADEMLRLDPEIGKYLDEETLAALSGVR